MGISLKVLEEGKVLTTPTGQLIIAAAVIDDVIALILLAEVRHRPSAAFPLAQRRYHGLPIGPARVPQPLHRPRAGAAAIVPSAQSRSRIRPIGRERTS
eukprot:91383-Prorocentrum_minimum.AAC.1